MSSILRQFFLLLLCVAAGTMFAQERWNIDPRATKLTFTGEPASIPRANPNYVPPPQVHRVFNTPQGVYTVAPAIRVHPSTVVWQSEVPITRHPTNGNILFASSNAVRFSPTTIGEGMYVSTDGGVTWGGSDTTNAAPISGHQGDPAPAIGPDGRFYQSYITTGGMGASYSTNNGSTWANTITLVTGSQDKNHTFVDNTPGSPYLGRAYVTWSLFTAAAPPAVVSRSTDGGATWSANQQVLPVAAGHYAQGVNGAVGPNGVAYIAWQSPVAASPFTGDFIGFGKSTDGGVTWTGNSNAYDCNGIRGTLAPWSIRTNDFPSMAIDMTSSGRRGWIYIVTAEQNLAPAGSDPDIVMHRSTDGGTTWSAGVRVNQDALSNGKKQYMPWMCVDEGGGLNVIYYDNRNSPAGDSVEVMVSRSLDGGVTWTDIVASDRKFRPAPIPGLAGGYQGDYIGITAANGKVYPYWADNTTGIYQAWVTSITTTEGFGWVKGTISSLGTATAVSGATVDFVDPIPQVSGNSNASGLYYAGARVDTPATTRNVTMRARKFGFIDTTLAVTLTRNDTLTRNFQMRPAPGGTLSVFSHTATANLRSYVEVKFGTQVVVSDSTNATTGLLVVPLPIGTYSVRVDARAPYLTRNFPTVVITNGATTNVDALTTAVLTFNPTSARDTLPVGSSRTKTVVMANTSPDTVRFRITDDNALARLNRMVDLSLPSVKRSMEQQKNINVGKGEPDPIQEGQPASPDGRGGPDAFGYSWIDSDEPGGPVFNWFDISTIGTQITTLTSGTLDDGYATLPMPFAFPIYGTTFTSINIGTNGFVNFGTGSTSLSNGAIPSTAAPNNALYAFWDDLDLRTSGKLLYYNDVANGRFVVQYDKAPRFGTTATDTLSFQLLLKPNGEVTYQFLRVVGPVLNSGTMGVENATGTVALQVMNNTTYVHNNLAIRIFLPDAPWLSESPTLGAIPPNGNQNLLVTFDATGLIPGTTYNAKIFVDATHPDLTSPFEIPASLRVATADSAVMSLRKTSVTFPATQVSTTRRDTNWARNVGSLPLNISSITSTSVRYVVTPANGTVAAGDSLRIVVAYTPIAVGTDTGRVIILSNSQGTPRRDVTLTGTGTGAPSITVSTAAIADTLQIGQSHSKNFTITNSTPPPTTPLYVSITDSATWLTVAPASDTVAGSQTKNYNTTFNATGLAVGTYTTNIRISSNDPANPLKIIAATLRVTGGPVISTRPDSIQKTLAVGAVGVDSFYIKNTGLSALTWSLSETPGEATDMSNMQLKYYAAQPQLPKGMDYPVTDSPDTSGGPDAFGYRFIDSDSPGGPVFSWIDISATGAFLDSASAWIPTGTNRTGDEGWFAVRLPFSFNYYGVNKDSLYIGTNGNVMFQPPTGDVFTNATFPTAGGNIDNHVGVFWDDLEVRAGARVYYGASAGKFVVQYQNIARFAGITPAYTFEVVISPTGEIVTQYLNMGQNGAALNSASIGMENATGTIGLVALFNTAPPAYMHNNLAILFSRGVSWLDETPTSGSVNPGDSAKVRLDFNTVGLTAGSYRGIVSITSNDFARNPKNFPVRLTVTGGPSTVTVTAPNGGQNWAVGSVQQITWNQNGVDSVRIEYSTTGRTGTYIQITSGVPARPSTWIHPKGLSSSPIEGSTFDSDAGTYSWTIPNPPSTNCFVRIVRKSTGTPGDTSDAAFTISVAPPTGDTSWVVQPSGSTSTLYSVKAVSNNVAWVAGTVGVVLRTTNGGTNWTSVGGGAIGVADIYAIEALDANTAFVTTSPAATFIYKTTNGGTTWTQVYTLAGGFIDGIQMRTATEGYAVGDPVTAKWVVLKTTDGGTTWARMATEPAQVGAEAGWNNAFQLLGNTMWFGTNASRAYRSTDLGLTWTSATTPAVNGYGLAFNNATQGVLVSATGVTNRSTDGGTTWAAGGAAGTGQGSGASGIAGAEFWATVGTNVYYTTNGGTNWSAAAKNGYTGAVALWALDMVSPGAGSTYGWAGGATGMIVRYRRIPTDVAGGATEIPTVFALDQNFPNPFNPSTTIRFSLPEQATVSLKIYNLLGQEVATLASGDMPAAFHNVVWSGRNNSGSQVATGMYFYRLEATGVNGGKFNSLKKLILLK